MSIESIRGHLDFPLDAQQAGAPAVGNSERPAFCDLPADIIRSVCEYLFTRERTQVAVVNRAFHEQAVLCAQPSAPRDLPPSKLRMCLDYLGMKELGIVSCVSRLFREQALLCRARPLFGVSYGQMVEANRAAENGDDGPTLSLMQFFVERLYN